MSRASGILMHISSLPSKYGIGTMGEEAYKFVDFLKSAGQNYWQILPLGPTGAGDSPYQSFSTFAGNPYFIDLDFLERDGCLDRSDYESIDWGGGTEVDYGKIFENRFRVLKTAYLRSAERLRGELDEFRRKNEYWIDTYAMFMSLKFHFDLKPYREWDEDIRRRTPEAIAKYRELLADDMEFWTFVQYMFFKQWNELKKYANLCGIKIIGDIPIYVAEDSADAWAHSEILWLDDNLTPVRVAGCPPDAFTDEGQLWGNPLYNWNALRESGYDWWIKRIEGAFSLYDVVRIDHFRGFEAFYTIPYGAPNARGGEWIKGPAMDLFRAVREKLGDVPIIAEDLGDLTQEVYALLRESGYPGMKVLEFAFDPNIDSEYLPHNYPKNCVAYIGTHDNPTALGWLESEPNAWFAKDYLRIGGADGANWECIKSLMSSPADTVIVQMQDLLGIGSEGRMNTPSQLGCWRWRATDGYLTDEICEKLRRITKTYRR